MDETVHISSLVVQIQPRNLDALKEQCLAYKSREASIEIAAVDPAGKVVLLLATPSRRQIVDFIDWLGLVEGDATCITCHKGIAHELPDMAGVHGWE